MKNVSNGRYGSTMWDGKDTAECCLLSRASETPIRRAKSPATRLSARKGPKSTRQMPSLNDDGDSAWIACYRVGKGLDDYATCSKSCSRT